MAGVTQGWTSWHVNWSTNWTIGVVVLGETPYLKKYQNKASYKVSSRGTWLYVENIGQYEEYRNEIQSKSLFNNSVPWCQNWIKSGQYIP